MTRIANILAIAILGTTFTGCSLFSKSGTVRGDSGEIQNTQPETSQGDISTDKASYPLLDQLEGEWAIIKAGKIDVKEEPEEMPYLYFDNQAGRFYASNGCNIINGDFSSAGPDLVRFSNVLSTLNMCPDANYRNAINSVLSDGVKVKPKIYSEGEETYAELLSTGNSKLLTLRKHNMEELNGKWSVTKIGEKKIDDPEVNLFLDIPELKVHGNTGCNYFNGTILIDPGVKQSITFQDMAVTLRACPNQEIEMALLVALEQTHSYKKSGNTLTLISSSGKELATLKRA